MLITSRFSNKFLFPMVSYLIPPRGIICMVSPIKLLFYDWHGYQNSSYFEFFFFTAEEDLLVTTLATTGQCYDSLLFLMTAPLSSSSSTITAPLSEYTLRNQNNSWGWGAGRSWEEGLDRCRNPAARPTSDLAFSFSELSHFLWPLFIQLRWKFAFLFKSQRSFGV